MLRCSLQKSTAPTRSLDSWRRLENDILRLDVYLYATKRRRSAYIAGRSTLTQHPRTQFPNRRHHADPSPSDSVSCQRHSRRLIPVDHLEDLFHDLLFKKVDNVLPCALSMTLLRHQSYHFNKVLHDVRSCHIDKMLHTTLLQAFKWNELHHLHDLCLLHIFLKRPWTRQHQWSVPLLPARFGLGLRSWTLG